MGSFEIHKFKKLSFKNKDNLIFHREYSDQVHHLRDVNKWDNKNNNYLYSEIIWDEDHENTILLQGDPGLKTYQILKNLSSLLKNLGKVKNLIFIMLGLHLLHLV